MNFLLRAIYRAIMLTLIWGLAGGTSLAFIDDTPKRSLEVASILVETKWQQLEQGLSVIQVVSGSGVNFTAYRIDPSKFSFEIGVQDHPKGERAEHIGERLDAVLAINGGFFGETKSNELYPVGLMSSAGVPHGEAWRTSGGYLVFGKEILVRPSAEGMPLFAGEFVQSKPVLIESGGSWAMNTNSNRYKRRSIVCLQKNGEIVFSLVTGAGLSLFESGWLMRSKKDGGYFDCDAAIAMDGGGSSQTWVAEHPELSLRGISPVHNFLIVKRK